MVCFCCYPAGNGHISHQTGKGKSFDSKVPLAGAMFPSKIDWDLTNGPLSKLLEPLDTQVEGSVQWVLLEISWNVSSRQGKPYTLYMKKRGLYAIVFVNHRFREYSILIVICMSVCNLDCMSNKAQLLMFLFICQT